MALSSFTYRTFQEPLGLRVYHVTTGQGPSHSTSHKVWCLFGNKVDGVTPGLTAWPQQAHLGPGLGRLQFALRWQLGR